MYLPLCDIVVEHQFFTNGIGRTFTVSPTVQTEELAAKVGLLSRRTPHGIRIVYNVQHLEALQRYASNAQPALRLGFKLDSTDHLFASYTEPMCPDDSIFYCDALCAQAESSESYRLHREAHVSASEVEPLGSPRVDELLDQADRGAPPLGLIHISLAPAAGGLLEARVHMKPRTYYVRFAARQTYWTYYLLGHLARDALYIEDAKGETEFDLIGEVSLPGNRVARAFRSTSRLLLQDRYHHRFQLVEPGANGGRVLIARLPGAHMRQTYQERLNGMDRAVSEIFIHSRGRDDAIHTS